MEIKPPAASPPLIVSETPASQNSAELNRPVTSQWQVGQILQALVIKIENEQLLLNIQGQLAVSPRPAQLPVQDGDRLQLEILQRDPGLVFRVLNKPTIQPLQQLIDQQLRNIVVKQQPLSPLFKHISTLLNPPTPQAPRLPAIIQTRLRDFFQQLPSVLQVKTAPQLRQHLQQSGVFLEQQLIQPQVSKLQLQKDLRVSLMRLATLLRQQLPTMENTALARNTSMLLSPESAPAVATTTTTATLPPLTPQLTPASSSNGTPKLATADAAPPASAEKKPVQTTASATPRMENLELADDTLQTLLHQVESSVARIQQQQLQSLQHELQQGRPVWLMELPIRDGQDVDIFQLRIEEQERQQVEKNQHAVWAVTLNFELQGLGAVSAYVQLRGDQVTVNFRTEQAHTRQLFQQHFNHLRERLLHNGLDVAKLDCVQQQITPLFQAQRNLLDTRA